MPTSGVDYPSKTNTIVMVGVPATNELSAEAKNADQAVYVKDGYWYALYFDRKFISYTGNLLVGEKYLYIDTNWYGVRLCRVGENGSTSETPPQEGASDTDFGIRYHELAKPGTPRDKMLFAEVQLLSPERFRIKRGERVEFWESPAYQGWSPEEGAATGKRGGKEGWDSSVLVPPGSKEQPGGGGDGGTGNGAETSNEPVRITVKGPPRFNPPLISYASGAWTSRLYTRPDRQLGEPLREVETVPVDRKRILGPDQDGLRVNQRGILLSDFTHSQDWVYGVEDNKENDASLAPTVQDGGTEPSADQSDADGPSVIDYVLDGLFGIPGGTNNGDNQPDNTDAEPSSDPIPRWAKDQSALENGVQYGFRFHYNPSTISMGATIAGEVNPSLILAGRNTWNPIGGLNNLGTVTFTLYLNRIEDMSFWKKVGTGYEWAGAVDVKDAYSGMMPGPKEREGIMTRGTEYDLEFLFRTILGRPFPTKLRGRTANLGMLWGTPCQLWLSRHMRYTGRVTNISWSHRSFNRWMVPMWTEVTISFTRFPDALSALDAPETSTIGLIDGYPYDNALGYTLFDRENLGAEGWNTGGTG